MKTPENPGDPIALMTRGGICYGRLLRRGGEFRAKFTMVTPHGSVYTAGFAWYRPMGTDGMAQLREFERMAPRLYGGKLDHIIGHTVRWPETREHRK